MSNIAKVIEVVASSREGWEDAVRVAVREASKTVRGITGVDVQDWTARVVDGELVNYKVNVKLAFGIEGEGGDYGDGGDRRDSSDKKGRKNRKNR